MRVCSVDEVSWSRARKLHPSQHITYTHNHIAGTGSFTFPIHNPEHAAPPAPASHSPANTAVLCSLLKWRVFPGDPASFSRILLPITEPAYGVYSIKHQGPANEAQLETSEREEGEVV